ncbi:MAG: RNA-binding protein [Verrucomicrobiota bacterium]
MKLYMGNLPFSFSEADLREVLEPFAPIVDVHLPIDRETGNPRGFAFVTLSSRELGEQAIEALNGAEIGGRNARVSEAEERRPQNNRGGDRGGYGGGGDRDNGYGGGGGGYGGGGGGDRKYRKERTPRENDGKPRKRYRSI